MRLLIKFNNIRDLSDGRYAAAQMAEWMGFSVGLPDSLPAAKIQEIAGWCAGPKLILELAAGLDPNILDSYLDVLPVDGLEMEFADFVRLHPNEKYPDLIVIVRGDSDNLSSPKTITHSPNFRAAENHIQRMDPGLIQIGQFIQNLPWAISLDCFDDAEPALKNYDIWNDFFDALEDS